MTEIFRSSLTALTVLGTLFLFGHPDIVLAHEGIPLGCRANPNRKGVIALLRSSPLTNGWCLKKKEGTPKERIYPNCCYSEPSIHPLLPNKPNQKQQLTKEKAFSSVP